MCGLSRARFYQLDRFCLSHGLSTDVATRRPFYGEEAQKVCLEVRRRNCGIDGTPILFYAKRLPVAPLKRMPRPAPESRNNCSRLVEGLRALGLSVSSAQVESAVKELGLQGREDGEAVRAIFLHLKRKGV